MSGGDSRPDPYYQKDPPKRAKKGTPPRDMKSYKNAVKPTRIEIGPDGKKRYYYSCAHCGKEIEPDKRKKNQRAFCDRKCHNEWQKYGKPPSKLSEEGRRKLSDHKKAMWGDPEQRKKIRKAHDKAVKSPDYRKQRSKSAKEVASRPDWKAKQSAAQKGKTRPKDVGKKISKAKMGHPVSDDTKKKIADALRGEKSSFYIDGGSSERQKFYSSWQWKKQAQGVLERDNHRCQGCGLDADEAGGLGVHHIRPIRDPEVDPYDYPDDMLASLCKVCHAVTDLQDGDLKWPINGRGEKAKLDRLRNPKYRRPNSDDSL